jgi:hypothetical protein
VRDRGPSCPTCDFAKSVVATKISWAGERRKPAIAGKSEERNREETKVAQQKTALGVGHPRYGRGMGSEAGQDTKE